MKTFLPWLSALLLLVLCYHPAAAQTPAVVVQAYLDARAAGQYEKAYALLSPATQTQVTLDKFTAETYVQPRISLFPESKHVLEERLAPVYAFFLDARDTQHYAFRVLGPDPDTTGGVLLFAQAPGALSGTSIPLSITTTSEGTGPPRLDLSQSIYGNLRRERERARQVVSRSNLRIIALGILQYALDHHEHFPDASRWTDEVMPYVKDKRHFHDPSAPDGPQGTSDSYAFNCALSGQSLGKVTSPASTVMLFESTKSVKNASDTGQSVPRPGRHSGGTDYAFADGHGKSFKDGSFASKDKGVLSYTLSGK